MRDLAMVRTEKTNMKKPLLTILTAIWEVLKGLPSQIAKCVGWAIIVGFVWWLIASAWNQINQINNKFDQLSRQATILDAKFEDQFHSDQAKARDIDTINYMIQIGEKLLQLTDGRDPYSYNLAAKIQNDGALELQKHPYIKPTNAIYFINNIQRWWLGNWFGWQKHDDTLTSIDAWAYELSARWKAHTHKFAYFDPTRNIRYPDNMWKTDMKEFLRDAQQRLDYYKEGSSIFPVWL
jgi:hypothetical protein